MPLFETNKRRREAKEFKATVAKGKKDYKNIYIVKYSIYIL